MGQIKKQSFFTSLFLYLSIGIGFLNSMVFMPWVLTPDEIGFFRFWISIVSVIALVVQTGFPNAIIKFYSLFRDDQKASNAFYWFTLIVPLIGITITCLLFILFKETIIDIFNNEDSLELLQKYYHLFPLALAPILYFNVLKAHSTTFLRTALPAFLQNSMQKIVALAVLLLLLFKLTDSSMFYYIFLVYLYLQVIIMIINLRHYYSGPVTFSLSFMKYVEPSYFMRYMLFGLFSGASYHLIQSIDSIMVSKFSVGEFADTGIFTTFSTGGLVVGIPAAAISGLFFPIIAKAWNNYDLATIDNAYKKTSLIQLIIGALLFIGIWANIDNLLEIISFRGADYSAGKWVLFIIGLAKLIDVSAGANGGIIVYSKYYYIDLIFLLSLVIMSIFTNYYFIRTLGWGINGAAIATLLSILAHNILKFIFVYYKFKLQPFGFGHLKVLFSLGIVWLIQYYIFQALSLHFLVDLVLRSLLITILYGTLIYFLNTSPMINTFVKSIPNRIKALMNS